MPANILNHPRGLENVRDVYCKKKKIDTNTVWYRLVLSITTRIWHEEWLTMQEIDRRIFCEEILNAYKFY